MITVKLTYNYDWPLFRQTPNSGGVWGNYRFVIDDNLKECDYWVIYSDYLVKEETVKCNPDNTYFIPAECYNTSPKFNQQFLNQFAHIITVQRELKHKNIIFKHNANPWFVGKNYDELINLEVPTKNKLISVISSNKSFTKGHRKRLEFVAKLVDFFGDQIDVFGRGINDFEDKWDVLADYKYSIAIENDNCEDWVTEKFFDCIYAFTYPIYYGCPNLENYFDNRCFSRIDIDNPTKSIEKIKQVIENKFFEKNLEAIKMERIISLGRDNLFPFLCNIFEENKKPDSLWRREWVKICNYDYRETFWDRLMNKIKH